MKSVVYIVGVLLAGTLACTPAKKSSSLDLTRLKALDGNHGGKRTLATLDVSGDGKLDTADAALFDAVALAANNALASAGKKLAVEDGLYHGPKKDAPPAFGLLATKGDAIDLTGVPADRLPELAVESKWAAAQARLASGRAASPEPFGGLMISGLAGYNKDKMEPADVCKAVANYDVSAHRKAGVKPIAVFDLDSTVWEGNVSEVFLSLLSERKVPLPETNAVLQEFLKGVEGLDPAVIGKNDVATNAGIMLERSTNRSLPKEQQVNAAKAFYNTVSLLTGLTPAQLQPVARAAFLEGTTAWASVNDRVFADEDGCGMREIIAAATKAGIEVYMLSASLDLLAKEAANHFGIPPKNILGSMLEVKNGRYTGEVSDSTYFTKGSIVRQWLPGPPVFVFGDSPSSDFSMLVEASSAAFMVNARDRLQALDDKEAGSRMVAVWFDGTRGSLAAKNNEGAQK